MKTLLAFLVLFVGAVVIAVIDYKPAPPDPASMALCRQASDKWLKREPLGVVNVKVDCTPRDATASIEYGLRLDRSLIPEQQRQLIRALLAEWKAQGVELPRLILVFAHAIVRGESGGPRAETFDMAKWDSRSDTTKFEKFE